MEIKQKNQSVSQKVNTKPNNKNASFNQQNANVTKNKFAYDVDTSTDSFQLQTKPKFQANKIMK